MINRVDVIFRYKDMDSTFTAKDLANYPKVRGIKFNGKRPISAEIALTEYQFNEADKQTLLESIFKTIVPSIDTVNGVCCIPSCLAEFLEISPTSTIVIKD